MGLATVGSEATGHNQCNRMILDFDAVLLIPPDILRVKPIEEVKKRWDI